MLKLLFKHWCGGLLKLKSHGLNKYGKRQYECQRCHSIIYQQCWCGVEYNEFRTGLTFRDVSQMLHLEADRKYNQGEYMFITRHTVLGRWHEIKMKMWKEWCEIGEEQIEYENIEIEDESQYVF